MGDLNEIERGQLCQSTIESLYEATGGLKHFPALLKKIIENKAWERRISKGKVIELSSLRELITEKPIRGWGEDPKKVEAVIKEDPECLALFYEAMQLEAGRPTTQSKESTNIVSRLSAMEHLKEKRNTIQGNSKAYTCERLSKVAPELFEEVKAGRMSANAAAIQAGIRRKPSPLEVCVKNFCKSDNRLETLRAIVDRLEPQEIVVLSDWLEESKVQA